MDDGLGSAMDRRRFLITGGAVSAGVALGVWGCRSPRDEEVENLPPRVVGLRSLGGSFRFDPPGLRVEPGEEVHWLNMGDFHSVTAFHPAHDPLVPAHISLRMPEGAAPYHSGMLGLTAGTQFTHRFELEGVYDYFCQPHYSFGMVGRVIVGEPVDGPALDRPEDDLVEAARGNMPSVEDIIGPRGASLQWAARVNGVLYTLANGGDGVVAAEAVAQGALRDRRLRSWLEGDGLGAVGPALSALVDEAKGAAGYEAVLRRADEVKRIMREAGPSP